MNTTKLKPFWLGATILQLSHYIYMGKCHGTSVMSQLM